MATIFFVRVKENGKQEITVTAVIGKIAFSK
jgi:hypothetical protein